MDKLLDRHYGDATANPLKRKSDYISLQSNLVSTDVKASQTVKAKRKFLPLLLFYNWDYSNVATLNSNLPLANFDATLLSYASAQKLREKLNGRKVELMIDSIPHRFEIEDKGWMAYLLFFRIGSEVVTINPDMQDLIVRYKIWQDNNVVKTGNITIENHDRIVRQKFLQFSNKWIHNYLDGYDEHIKIMTRQLVDKLLLEI